MPERIKAYRSIRDEKGRLIAVEEAAMYPFDAQEACARHPQEWSMTRPRVGERGIMHQEAQP